jgi:hypothetical protein
MMFTRRHYRIIALIIGELLASAPRAGICPRALVAAFARGLEADNPRFNRAAFERAIGLEDQS